MITNNPYEWFEIDIVCEGQTEIDFVNVVLNKYFNSKQIKLKPLGLNGNVSIDRLIDFLCRCNTQIITTLVDYYGFKNNHDNVNCLENKILENFNKKNKNKKILIPYIQMHEFEALLFSDISVIAKQKNANSEQIDELEEIIKEYNDKPEDINNSKDTAPSKRLEKIFKDYKKIIDSKTVSREIGIHNIREKCERFNKWLNEIENKVKEMRK